MNPVELTVYYGSCMMGLVMDVVQRIPCLVVRYVNVACRKRTITMFSKFDAYISYMRNVGYDKLTSAIFSQIILLEDKFSYPSQNNGLQ